jgi:hypothetical protein
LVAQERDEAMLSMAAQVRRATGANLPAGFQEDARRVVISYEKNGLALRDEIRAMISVHPALKTEQSRMTLWNLNIASVMTAPADSFERDRPLLYALGNSARPTPQWSARSSDVIMEAIHHQGKVGLERIRERARMFDKLSDDQIAAYRARTDVGDAAQRQRINSIYEVEGFKEPGGSTVNLPIHYQHAYGDGNGNYVLSNRKLDSPGSFQELQRVNP